MPDRRSMFQVSDALLPLLDVAMLLLGLFMILMAVQASTAESETDDPPSIESKLPSNIMLVLIEEGGEVWIKHSGEPARVPDGAKNLVRQIENLIKEDGYAVLMVENPADRKSYEVYRQCARELLRSNIRFARGQN